MNLLISYNWLKKHVKTNVTAEEFARRISLCGPAAERLYPQAAAFANMVVGVIKEVKPHPNADKLRIVMTDIGGRIAEIVCGGSNLDVGKKVAVALPGARVKWHGEGELIELKPTEIRGVKSDGMICGASEIGLEAGFPGGEKEIVWLDVDAKAGTPLAKALDLEDTVFDIEVTTNRVDAFSAVGMAREAAVILDAPFLWKPEKMPALSGKPLKLAVKNAAPKLCTRYQAVVMDGVKVGSSPWWLRRHLMLSGVRSINNVVDITNYVMLELGQPMHAFDYAKLEGSAINVRGAKVGEKMKALDGKEYALAEGQLVIADAGKPVAIAGVMGGEETGVTAGTTAVVFESATFDPVSVRRTARALNLHSDSSLRFEKGLPEEQTAIALACAAKLCAEIAGGRVASKTFDLWPKKSAKKTFAFRPEKAQALIGEAIPAARMVKILSALGFAVTPKGAAKSYRVGVPYWRARDIEGERDFAEEIARIFGYHNIKPRIPAGAIPESVPDETYANEEKTKAFLRGAGFTETVEYSFVSEELLRKDGADPARAVAVANPLSSDFVYMRTSLMPSTLTVVAQNQALFPEGKFFEMANVYAKQPGAELPHEKLGLMIAIYGGDKSDRYFRELKGVYDALLDELNMGPYVLGRVTSAGIGHPGRSLAIFHEGGKDIGGIAEIHPSISAKFGVDRRVAMLGVDFSCLTDQPRAGSRYAPIPAFPPVRRDLAFTLDERAEYAEVESAIRGAASLLREAELFDVYQGDAVGKGKKSMALHLAFAHPERTLTAEEADAEMEKISLALREKFQAELRK